MSYLILLKKTKKSQKINKEYIFLFLNTYPVNIHTLNIMILSDSDSGTEELTEDENLVYAHDLPKDLLRMLEDKVAKWDKQTGPHFFFFYICYFAS